MLTVQTLYPIFRTYIIYRYVERDDLFLQYYDFPNAKEDLQQSKEKVCDTRSRIEVDHSSYRRIVNLSSKKQITLFYSCLVI